MSAFLSDLIFSETISESVKLELLNQILEKTSQEMMVESLFLNAKDVNDYVHVLECIPRVGVFRDIKKDFWKKVNTLDEALIFEVTTAYIEKHAGNKLPHELKLAKERQAAEDRAVSKKFKNDSPVGLAQINKAYKEASADLYKNSKGNSAFNKAREEAKAARLQRVKDRASKLAPSATNAGANNGNKGKVSSMAGFKDTIKDLTGKLRDEGNIGNGLPKQLSLKDAGTSSKKGTSGFKDTAKELTSKLNQEGNIGKGLPKQLSLKDAENKTPEQKSEIGNTETQAVRNEVRNKLNGTSTTTNANGSTPKTEEKEEKTPSKNLFDQIVDKQLDKKEEESKQNQETPKKEDKPETTAQTVNKPEGAKNEEKQEGSQKSSGGNDREQAQSTGGKNKAETSAPEKNTSIEAYQTRLAEKQQELKELQHARATKKGNARMNTLKGEIKDLKKTIKNMEKSKD